MNEWTALEGMEIFQMMVRVLNFHNFVVCVDDSISVAAFLPTVIQPTSGERPRDKKRPTYLTYRKLRCEAQEVITDISTSAIQFPECTTHFQCRARFKQV
jgi:hypothetical protein